MIAEIREYMRYPVGYVPPVLSRSMTKRERVVSLVLFLSLTMPMFFVPSGILVVVAKHPWLVTLLH